MSDIDLGSVTRHPLSSVFGDMSTEERNDLKNSIHDVGFTDPYIVILEGQVYDGWNRLSVARELGCVDELDPVEFGELFEESPPDAVQYALAKNLNRRHLSASKRATIVASLVNWTGKEKPVTLKEAADMAGVSVPTMTDAKKVVDAGKADEILDSDKSVSSVAKNKEPKKKTKKKEVIAVEVDDADDIAAVQQANNDNDLQDALQFVETLKRRQSELESVVTAYEVDTGKKPDGEVERVHRLQGENSHLRAENERLSKENMELTREITKMRKKQNNA